MAAEIEAATEKGLKTVVDGSAVLCRKTEDMRGALLSIHAASDQAAGPRTTRVPSTRMRRDCPMP